MNPFCAALSTNIKAEAGWDKVVDLMSAAVHTPALYFGPEAVTPTEVADALMLMVTL